LATVFSQLLAFWVKSNLYNSTRFALKGKIEAQI
jgi:hypothetical protein